MFGRVELESDDVVEFLGEARIVTELEGLDAMRFEIVSAPDAAHRRDADAGLGGHRAAAPVGGVGRGFAGGFVDNPPHLIGRDGGRAGGAAFTRTTGPKGPAWYSPMNGKKGMIPIPEVVGHSLSAGGPAIPRACLSFFRSS